MDVDSEVDKRSTFEKIHSPVDSLGGANRTRSRGRGIQGQGGTTPSAQVQPGRGFGGCEDE
eukprot:1022132-Karenia_brevis.AAC.1